MRGEVLAEVASSPYKMPEARLVLGLFVLRVHAPAVAHDRAVVVGADDLAGLLETPAPCHPVQSDDRVGRLPEPGVLPVDLPVG